MILTSYHDRSRRGRRVAKIVRNRIVVPLDSRTEDEELLHRPCNATARPVGVELLQREEVSCHSCDRGRGQGCPSNFRCRGIAVDAGDQHITSCCIYRNRAAAAEVGVGIREQGSVLLYASDSYEAIVGRAEVLRRDAIQAGRRVVARGNDDGDVLLLGKGDDLIHDQLAELG